MNLRKIALGLLFGGALAVGSIACDDSSSSTGDTGGTPQGNLPQPCATIGSDTDSATTPFVEISTLSLPTDLGFNLDGINNAQRGGAGGGSNATIEGCGKVDLKFGLDNSLAKIADDLSGTINLNMALDETLLANGGTLQIEAQLNHLSAADAATDSCVGATVRVGGAAGQLYTGSGSLTDHVASISFGAKLTFEVALTVPAESCGTGGCQPASLEISIDRPVATIKLNAANTEIEPGSIIGGYIFFQSDEAGYDALNAAGFGFALSQFAHDVNLTSDIAGIAVNAFKNAADLHVNANGTIGTCSSPTNNLNATNRNTVSVALAVDSN